MSKTPDPCEGNTTKNNRRPRRPRHRPAYLIPGAVWMPPGKGEMIWILSEQDRLTGWLWLPLDMDADEIEQALRMYEMDSVFGNKPKHTR